jgi:endonuclease YncB( thermonuclease family)
MRQIPLYVLTVLVALGLIYAFVAPFHGALDTPAIASQGVDITPENFDLPDEMQNDTPSDAPEASKEATEPQAEAAQPQGRVVSPARQVDPDGFSLSESDAMPLQRVEPRQPLSQMGQALPPAPPTPPAPPIPPAAVDDTAKPLLLYRPVAAAAGEIDASGYRIVLGGIEAVPPEETCNAGGGPAWHCGMAARTAFRGWLRSRAVECNVPALPPKDVIATSCKLGNVDVAQWLVENGWARAKDGTPLADAMKKASDAKRGIFGSEPAALPVENNLQMPSFSDAPSGDMTSPSEPLPAPPPLTAPNAPFPPRPQ